MNKPQENFAENQKWWQNKRAKTAGMTIAALFFLAFIYWLFNIMPYVSTEDARIDAPIIKIANLGATGQTISVNFKEGDYVHAGDIIAELDHSTAKALYDKAESKAMLADNDLTRAKAMSRQQGISRQQLEKATAEAMSADADAKIAKIALDRTYIKSPADGIIIQKTSETGNILESNQTAVIIADIQKAKITANIQEKSVGTVKAGQKVKIKIDEGGSLTGKVSEVRNASASVFALIPSENSSGNFVKVEQRIPVTIELDPGYKNNLRIGQSVVLKIKVR